MRFRNFTLAAGAAILAAALAGPASAQNNANGPSLGAPSAAPRAPSAAPAAPSPRPMNAAPGRIGPSAGIHNRSNFSAYRPGGTTNFARNGNWNRGNWSHHRRGHWNGYAYVPFGYYGPSYYDDYAYEDVGPDCTLQRRVFHTRSGHRYVRWVQVCD